MDPIGTAKQFEKLSKRREQVAITLQHIEKERNEAEQNTDWLDQAGLRKQDRTTRPTERMVH